MQRCSETWPFKRFLAESATVHEIMSNSFHAATWKLHDKLRQFGSDQDIEGFPMGCPTGPFF